MAVGPMPETEQLSYWTAVAVLVSMQLIFPLTHRDLYIGFFADRLIRTA